MATRITLRSGSAADWALANPVLAKGEPGFDSTNKAVRVGDGKSTWDQLVPSYGLTSVSVVTLSDGEEATGAFEEGTLVFGIPRGAPGTPGQDGLSGVPVDPSSPTVPTKQWFGTQAQYDAVIVKDPQTIYTILE